MSAIGSKLRLCEGNLVMFWCPGCDGAHSVSVNSGIPGRDWAFNGDGDKPTFSPSVLVTSTKLTEKGDLDIDQWRKDGYPKHEDGFKFDSKPSVCHSFVTDGRIQFLGDCTHALAGQTVDLPDFDEA